MSFDPSLWRITAQETKSALRQFAGNNYTDGLNIIFDALLKNRHQAPKLGFVTTPPIKNYISKWVEAYIKGYNNRPSKRKGRPSGTVPDNLIKEIYGISHNVASDQLELIANGHATMMTLEKIVGDLLEEYLATELQKYGWHCCWGQTIKAVDFCHESGILLQVKTSDNSENSSSKAVRNGTGIQKWQRRKSRKANVYYWGDLIAMTKNPNLSEENFKKFINNVLRNNPGCIHVGGS